MHPINEGARRGAARTAFAVGLVELAAAGADRSAVDRIGRAVIDRVPIPVAEETVRFVGLADKPLLRAALTGALGGLGAAVGGALGRGRPRASRGRAGGDAALAIAGVAAFVGARARLAGRRTQRERCDAERALPVAHPLPAPVDGAEHWPEAVPLLTPPGDFYVTDVNMRPPALDRATWRLAVAGLDGRTRHLDWDALCALGLRERDAVLVCVHDRPGWDRLGNQRWTGVPLVEVLRAAGALAPGEEGEVDIVLGAVDGYAQVLPGRFLVEAQPWVVLGMGRRPLTEAHGAPARVLTPGLVGQYSGAKWLTSLRVVPARSELATWPRRGWPHEPVPVRPRARIDFPASPGTPPRLPLRPLPLLAGPEVALVGTAWAPPRGVGRVEVRLDGGGWEPAHLAHELAPESWRRWRLAVRLPAGQHRAAVRAIARDEEVQDGTRRAPFPSGVTAYHEVRFRVR